MWSWSTVLGHTGGGEEVRLREVVGVVVPELGPC